MTPVEALLAALGIKPEHLRFDAELQWVFIQMDVKNPSGVATRFATELDLADSPPENVQALLHLLTDVEEESL